MTCFRFFCFFSGILLAFIWKKRYKENRWFTPCAFVVQWIGREFPVLVMWVRFLPRAPIRKGRRVLVRLIFACCLAKTFSLHFLFCAHRTFYSKKMFLLVSVLLCKWRDFVLVRKIPSETKLCFLFLV